LAKPCCGDTVLKPCVEHDLESYTDSENRFAPGKARVNDLVSTRLDECRHDSVERSHSGNNEPVSVEGPRTISGQGDRSTRVLKGLQRRVDIARTIVKDDDALCHD
jgi:hypothetical protein